MSYEIVHTKNIANSICVMYTKLKKKCFEKTMFRRKTRICVAFKLSQFVFPQGPLRNEIVVNLDLRTARTRRTYCRSNY